MRIHVETERRFLLWVWTKAVCIRSSSMVRYAGKTRCIDTNEGVRVVMSVVLGPQLMCLLSRALQKECMFS